MKIVFLGKYVQGESLSGPEKFSKCLFENVLLKDTAVFVEYFFKYYTNCNLRLRLIGSEKVSSNPEVYRYGHLPLFIYLLIKRPDIIHILSSERYTILIFLYKFIIGSKVVTTFHSVLRYEITNNTQKRNEFNRYRDYLWEWLAIKLSDKLIFLSRNHLSLAEKYYKINKNKIDIIPNGVEREFLNLNKDFQINDFLKIVFYNGQKDSIERGINTVLKVINNSHLPLKLYVIGDKFDLTDINLSVEFMEIMGKTDLIHFLSDKHILLKSPSFDTFPIFTIECMAAGLIVVLSDNTGTSAYIKNGNNGFVYNNNEPENINSILEDIYNAKYDPQTISDNARKIIDDLDWDSISNKYIDCYKSIL